MGDTLYARLNTRGKKQFKASGRQSFIENFGPYENLGLPAHKAALDGNVECLKECFSSFMKDGVPSRDVNGATPLHLAARSNRSNTVKWLLRFTDIPVTATAKHGETPAHVAAVQGHVESLKQILMADAKGDIKTMLATAVDNSGFSALHLAILKHRNECAKLLISELGAKAVNALNESGVTAVHLAASAGNVEVLHFLGNKHKKLLNQADNEGASPVYYAAQEGRLDVLQFLCEKCRCDLSVPCNDGLKPIHAASQCGHTNIVKYIVSQLGNQVIFDTTPDGATPLHFATSSEHLHTAQWLINSDAGGMLVRMKDGNGDTPAHDAADSGHVPMLRLLLENGADLYAINNDGNTPYSLALSGGNMDTANYVMTYASKSPQRDSGGPVRIFNMQGEMDVVDMKKSSDPELSPQQNTNNSNQHTGKINSNQESQKKQGKGIQNSNSFIGNTSQTLQSFNTAMQAPEAVDDNSAALDMTEDEMAIFHGNKPLLSDAEHIVVRYSAPAATNPTVADDRPEEPGYATVNEIVMQEEKREKKKERKISKKSFLKAISPKKENKAKKGSPSKAIGGPEMGFKPQFHSNPLMKFGGSIPPAPPPTPATATSIAPSDEAPQHNLEDVEEDAAFAPYATPDPEIVKMKSKQRALEEQNMLKNSENQKLLKDALEDLSGDESPPEIPKQAFGGEVVEQGSTTKDVSRNEVKLKPVSPRRELPPSQDGDVASKFPVLRPVRREPLPVEKKAATELSQIKLKSTDWKHARYDRETETTGGTTDELKNILKKKVVN